MSGYVLSEDADLDLDEIWEYIAQDNTLRSRKPGSLRAVPSQFETSCAV